MSTPLNPRFQHRSYLVRRKILKLFGDAFHIYDPSGAVVFYSELKAFKLKEDIRLYTGEAKGTEALVIKARQILDISASYDVFDPVANEKVGVLQREGLKSVVFDSWLIKDSDDKVIGRIREDHWVLALARRFITPLIPQHYQGDIGGTPVCKFSQNFNPFVMKITLDFSLDMNHLLDRRLGIAAAVLLCAIEGKQK